MRASLVAAIIAPLANAGESSALTKDAVLGAAKKLEQRIHEAMKETGVSGIAVGIVFDEFAAERFPRARSSSRAKTAPAGMCWLMENGWRNTSATLRRKVRPFVESAFTLDSGLRLAPLGAAGTFRTS